MKYLPLKGATPPKMWVPQGNGRVGPFPIMPEISDSFSSPHMPRDGAGGGDALGD